MFALLGFFRRAERYILDVSSYTKKSHIDIDALKINHIQHRFLECYFL